MSNLLLQCRPIRRLARGVAEAARRLKPAPPTSGRAPRRPRTAKQPCRISEHNKNVPAARPSLRHSPGHVRHAELQVATNYSFLRGASHVEELFAQADAMGLAALGVTDRNSLAGIARAHQRAAETRVPLVVGCRLDLSDATSVLVYPTDRPAYARLCQLLTRGRARADPEAAGKPECRIAWRDLAEAGEGLLAALLPGRAPATRLGQLREAFGDRAYLALTLRRRPGDAARLERLARRARAARVGVVATNDVLFHIPARRILQDVLTCIREGCTIDDAGFRRERHAARHLKSPAEMARL